MKIEPQISNICLNQQHIIIWVPTFFSEFQFSPWKETPLLHRGHAEHKKIQTQTKAINHFIRLPLLTFLMLRNVLLVLLQISRKLHVSLSRTLQYQVFPTRKKKIQFTSCSSSDFVFMMHSFKSACQI